MLTAARFCEHVQENHHVGIAFRVMLVDPELTAASRGTPIHVADPVSGHELTDVGELDPLRFLARNMVAGEDLRLRGAKQPHDLLGRVDLSGWRASITASCRNIPK